jgi:hypothetical protein
VSFRSVDVPAPIAGPGIGDKFASEQRVAPLPVSFMDYLCFALIFWLQLAGTFRFASSGKSVSQTYQPGIRPALPTTQAQGAHPRRSRRDTPLHSISNAEIVPES